MTKKMRNPSAKTHQGKAKSKAETAKKERVQIAPQYNRVTILINDLGETPLFDEYVYASVERKLFKFLEGIKPLPKQLWEKADAQWKEREKATDQEIKQRAIDRSLAAGEKRLSLWDLLDSPAREKLELENYQKAADQLAAFIEDENNPAELRAALEETVIAFVNKMDGCHSGVEVVRNQLARACMKAGNKEEAS